MQRVSRSCTDSDDALGNGNCLLSSKPATLSVGLSLWQRVNAWVFSHESILQKQSSEGVWFCSDEE